MPVAPLEYSASTRKQLVEDLRDRRYAGPKTAQK